MLGGFLKHLLRDYGVAKVDNKIFHSEISGKSKEITFTFMETKFIKNVIIISISMISVCLISLIIKNLSVKSLKFSVKTLCFFLEKNPERAMITTILQNIHAISALI